MEEHFDERALLDRDTLKALMHRRDKPSQQRLLCHCLAFVGLLMALLKVSHQPLLAAPVSVLLAWVWCTLFAPFHECIHNSAFSTARANKLGAWITALPFFMAPAVYRTFHFEHHRHTQDPELDPELLGKTPGMQNPASMRDWRVLIFGLAMIDRKSTRLNSSHDQISYAVFCLKKKKKTKKETENPHTIKDRPTLNKHIHIS